MESWQVKSELLLLPSGVQQHQKKRKESDLSENTREKTAGDRRQKK